MAEKSYPASLEIDYPKQLDRFTTLVRIIWAIPILILSSILTASGSQSASHEAAKGMTYQGGGIVGGLFAATALMILFRQRYPRWWFNFALELYRFSARIGAYLFLLTDHYPSTEDEQSVHLEITYPNVKQDLNNWLPLIKWLLALPHYIILGFLTIGAILVTILAWFCILFTGRYPKGMFDYVVGVGRWYLRVYAYAILLTTDKYPPFSLE